MTDDLVQTDKTIELKINLQSYVCCSYDNNLYIGVVQEISQYGDVLIQFMSPMCLAKQYYWPKHEDKCWVKKENIKCVIETPSFLSSSSRGYSLADQDCFNIKKLLEI